MAVNAELSIVHINRPLAKTRQDKRSIHYQAYIGVATFTTSMMQRQLQSRRRLFVQCTNRRNLSSQTIVRQPMTAPPSQPPVVVSRQGWQAYRTKHPVVKKDGASSDKKKTSTDDSPWPVSVVYGSYFAAATLIPYFSTWYISANPDMRESVQPYLSEGVQEAVRHHFGKPDPDAMSYADIVNEGGDDESEIGGTDTNRDFFHNKIPIPHILPYEFTAKVRREQQAIQAQAAAPVNVKIQIVDDDSSDSFMSKQDANVQKVLGSTPARLETLLALTTAGAAAAAAAAPGAADSKLPAVAVDFLPDDDDNTQEDNGGTSFSSTNESSSLQSSMDSSTDDWSNSMTTGSNTVTSLTKKTKTVDPLQQTAHIFSSWHYQPPANVPETSSSSGGNKGNSNKGSNNNKGNSNSSANVTMDDIERSRLEYTVSELQRQLKDPNCLRSVDDMMDELKVAKAELSKLKWNKWGWK
jgi:hypothetical protein